MSEVAFHFNAPDKLPYACRLLRKAHAKGSTVFVLVEPDQADRLDSALWTFAQDAFIPHCLASAPDWVKKRSKVLIGTTLPENSQAEVLVNLQMQWAGDWTRFERLVEVVSEEEADRQAARERWRRYRAEGADPVHHDLRANAG